MIASKHPEFQYLELINLIINDGEKTMDRTGVGTYSYFGGQELRFDLREGFPLLTTKKIFTRGLIEELLWFLRGETNAKILEDKGVNIWKQWGDPETRDMGPIYGKQMRDWNAPRKLHKVHPRIIPNDGGLTFENIVPDSFDEVRQSNKYGTFRVLKTYHQGEGRHKRKLCDIQFLLTGYVLVGSRYDAMMGGRVRDPYFPIVCSTACQGRVAVETDLDKNLYKTWQHMMERCYDKTCKEYKYYGAQGVFVCKRWLCFEDFRRDVTLISGWRHKREMFSSCELDKDYYSSNCYSPDTCVWLSASDNILYRKNGRAIRGIDPSGVEYLFMGISGFAERHGLQGSKISSVLTGRRPHHKGWRFYEAEDGHLYRFPPCSAIDQVQRAENLIVKDPGSRRILINMWNVGDLESMALTPCHCLAQFKVSGCGEFLDLKLYQRSADIALGVPFNIASYALLLLMMARRTGKTPRYFLHSFGDAHIYLNHLDGIVEQLGRDPRPFPTMEILASSEKELDAYDIDDFLLKGYDPHPTIKFPIAV